MTEPCTHCGFAPGTTEPVSVTGADDDQASSFESSPTTFPEATNTSSQSAPTVSRDSEASQLEPPDSEPVASNKPARKKFWSAGRTAVAIIVALGIIGAISDDEKSDQTGPDPGQVESAVVKDGARLGVTVTVDCPDSVADSPVGGSFTCNATNLNGDVRVVSVANRSDEFAWQRSGLFELRRLDRPG